MNARAPTARRPRPPASERVAAHRGAVHALDEAAEEQRRIEAQIGRRRAAPDEGPSAGRRSQLLAQLAAERQMLARAQRERAERAERIERLDAAMAADRELVPAVEALIAALENASARDRQSAGRASTRPSTPIARPARAWRASCAPARSRRSSSTRGCSSENEARDRGRGAPQRAARPGGGAERELRELAGAARARRRARRARSSPTRSETASTRAASGWRAAASSSARSTRWPRRSTPRRVAHVEELERQRADLETALRELREADPRHRPPDPARRSSRRSPRPPANFEELVRRVFPGGSGRLRLVAERAGPGPRARRRRRAAGRGATTASEAGEADAARRRPGSRGPARRICSGVEIEITPAGKATKRLSLLSGGEKSMTALAFLFAVFLARPCPFYILDEVEAALDDLNIDRFLALLRRYSDARAVHRDHPPEAHDGGRRLAVRRLDGRRRRLEGALAAAAGRRRRGAAASADVARRALASGGSAADIVAAAHGARLERSVHHRRRRRAGAPARRERAAGAARRPASGACARAWRKTRQALRSEIQATLFGTLDERDLGAARGGADHGRRRRADDRLGRRAARAARPTEGKLDGRRGAVSERLIELLAEIARDRRRPRSTCAAKPTVILVAGVNGTGKTTTIGKLAWHLRQELGRAVLLGAGGHLPRGRRRAARAVGRARRRARSSTGAPGLGSRARWPSTAIAHGAPRGRRRGDRRHRRAPAHPGRPDGRARQGAARDRASRSRRRRTRRC